MASFSEIKSSFYGCYRFAKGDKGALENFNISANGFWASFSAVFISLFILVIQKNLELMGNEEALNQAGMETSVGELITVMVFAVLASWISYLLLTLFLARQMDFTENYSVFVIVYNWSQAFLSAVWLIIFLIVAGLLGAKAAAVFYLLFIGLSYVYLWFILQITLKTTGLTAFGIAFAEFLTAIVVQQIIFNMYF